MIVDFQDSDRMLGLKALGIYVKGIEAAKAACDKVYAGTMELQTAEGQAEAAREWIATSLEDMGLGETRELTTPSDSCLALRTAVSCYLSQLTKLSEKQSDLLVPVDDTNELISRLQSLSDRLSGQTEIPGTTQRDRTTATISVGGFTSEPMTTDDMANAGRHMAKR